ncbi:MAG: DUF420 domain-containing protein, partial [Blastochloris sp.]|nr:DUF420 domain-containing protein [Blastochloris sp.]
SLFLFFYLLHKFTVGPKYFPADSAIRPFYLALLLSHTVLAVVNLPMILRTMYLSWKGRLEEHKRIARWTFPIWLYVSITGVIIYLMLYQGLGN